MSEHVRQFLNDHRKRTDPVADQTAAVLGESEALTVLRVLDDFLTVWGEILAAYPDDALADSLLFAFSTTLPQKLGNLQADFLRTRYDTFGRELRFVWEMVCRARRADTQLAGRTLDEKAAWLAEEKLDWRSAVEPTLAEVFPDCTAAERKGRFKPIWDRLNQVCHPSAEWLAGGVGNSCRLLSDTFDEPLARQTLADFREVMGVVCVVFLTAFPAAVPRLAADAGLFEHCPQARQFLPPAGQNPAGPSG